MSKLDTRMSPRGAEAVGAPLTSTEIAELRQLLSVARFDARQGALVIDTGRARLTLRKDGTIRCEGVELVMTADRTITLNGAAIELN